MPHIFDVEIQNMVGLAGNVMDAFTAALFLVDEKRNDRLYLKACQTLSDNVIPKAVIRHGHGLIGWVAKHERPANARNFRHDTKTLQFYATDENIKSFAAAPVMDGDRLLGVLSVDSKNEYVFTEKKIKILSEFADNCARIITLGKRRIRLHHEAVNMKALSEIAEIVSGLDTVPDIARELRRHCPELIPHDHLAFAVKAPGDEGFRLAGDQGREAADAKPLALSHYRMGWVIRQARVINIPRLEAEAIPGDNKKWRSFLGAPVIANNEVTGAIGMLSRKPEAFRQMDAASITILASLCSSAITGLYLHDKARSAQKADAAAQAPGIHGLLERSGDLGEEGVAAVVDIKNFSSVNYELGFEGGDAVLRELAERLIKAVGDGGRVSRLGGDRFAITLPGHGKPSAVTALREVSASLESTPFHHHGTDIHVNHVIGAAARPKDGDNVESLLIKALKAVDSGKGSPGSHIVFYGDRMAAASARLRSLK